METKENKGRSASKRLSWLILCLVVMVSGVSLVVYKLGILHLHQGQPLFNRDTPGAAATDRDPSWATPLVMADVPNLHKVSDNLYRGAQPTAAGIKHLHELGIKTIVNLRSFHSDCDEIGDVNIGFAHIYKKTWHAEDHETIRFLQIVTDPMRTPVYVHCQRGSDRTGTMCAIYRIVVQGWTKDQAIQEMTQGGFGFYQGWQNLIDYIRDLNVRKIKENTGLSTSSK